MLQIRAPVPSRDGMSLVVHREEMREKEKETHTQNGNAANPK